MKTKQNKNQKKESGLSSRPDEQRSENSTAQQAPATPAPETKPARILPYVNFAERDQNRAVPTEQVLDLLRKWLPQAYDLAEVVGRWIWITFPEAPAEQVRGQTSQFGFHWNNVRKSWQHPCGQFATEGSGQDPRQKYGTRLAANQVAA